LFSLLLFCFSGHPRLSPFDDSQMTKMLPANRRHNGAGWRGRRRRRCKLRFPRAAGFAIGAQ
jgi:hypothetical protein